MLNNNFILVVSGPSGAGKSTIVNLFLQEVDNFALSVSYTTRKKREYEIEGVHYYFVTEEDFLKMVENNEFVEWANVFGNYYGTAKKEIERILRNDKNILLEIDVQGALSVKKNFPEQTVLVFILPETFSELKSRLAGRNTESQDELLKRIKTAEREIKQINFYDYVIINKRGCEKESVQVLKAISKVEEIKVKRFWDNYKELFWR
jgi:guanylate kinase